MPSLRYAHLTASTAALGLVDIRVLDHVVVGHEGFVSLAERGWL